MRQFSLLLISICFFSCTHPSVPSSDPESFIANAQPDELRIIATLYHGGAVFNIWSIQILNADLQFEYIDTSTGWSQDKTLHLTDARLAEIKHAITTTAFFQLPENMPDHPCYEDGNALTIRIAFEGNTIIREQCDPDLDAELPEVKRFVAVWNTIFADCDNGPKW